jgi:hypothetical protein
MPSGSQQQLFLQGPASSLSFEVTFRRVKASGQEKSSQIISDNVAGPIPSPPPQASQSLCIDANGKLKPKTEGSCATQDFVVTTTIPWQAKVIGRAEVFCSRNFGVTCLDSCAQYWRVDSAKHFPA